MELTARGDEPVAPGATAAMTAMATMTARNGRYRTRIMPGDGRACRRGSTTAPRGLHEDDPGRASEQDRGTTANRHTDQPSSGGLAPRLAARPDARPPVPIIERPTVGAASAPVRPRTRVAPVGLPARWFA